VVSVRRVGRDAIVWIDDQTRRESVPRAEIFVLRRGVGVAKRVASGWEVAGSADGRGVWVKAYVRSRRCVLREVDFRGHLRRAARRVPCTARLIDVGRAVVVMGQTVTDPATKRVLSRTGVWAIAGRFALTSSTSPRRLVLTDLQDGASWQLPWPSPIGGRDHFAVPRNQSRLALGFADPAYEGSGTQVMDLWTLDARTRVLEHVPDMPSAVSLKFTSVAFTADERLVILGESAGRRLVALWRAGQERLAVRIVRLPAPNGGSDSFVIL
jgi:hypothetical protein